MKNSDATDRSLHDDCCVLGAEPAADIPHHTMTSLLRHHRLLPSNTHLSRVLGYTEFTGRVYL